jgi:hypothetical protein
MSTPRPLRDLIPQALADIERRRDEAAVTSLFPLRLVRRAEHAPVATESGNPSAAPSQEDAAWSLVERRAA